MPAFRSTHDISLGWQMCKEPTSRFAAIDRQATGPWRPYILRLWKQLRRHVDQLPQTGLIADIDPKQPLNWRVLQQSKSIYGMLKGLAVLLTAQGRLPEDSSLSKTVAQLEQLLNRHHNATLWHADIEKRLKAYQLGLW